MITVNDNKKEPLKANSNFRFFLSFGFRINAKNPIKTDNKGNK
jgi:hypothetical protein